MLGSLWKLTSKCRTSLPLVPEPQPPCSSLTGSETFRTTLDVDLVGCFQCMKHQVAAMLEQPDGGSIVNCGSIFSHRGLPLGMPSYTAVSLSVTFPRHCQCVSRC